MSDIQRRIVTIFEARGANQVRAQLGEMRSGFAGYRRDIRGVHDDVGMLDRQMRAFATTMRYAVAGSTIFGALGEIRGLSQVQEQLGLISAISPTAFNNVALVGDALTQMGEQAEDAAYRALTPVNEFNNGLVNLVSTVQNVPRDQVVPILERIAQTSRLTLTPVDEATKGITGLAVAFNQPVNTGNIERLLALYQRAIFTVPGGAAAGPQIIQQLPQLAAVSRLSAVGPEQMFGLLNTVLRAGGSPSTSARGLQYLIQGLAQPPSDEARAALAGIGITPEFTQRQGGVAALLRLVQEVRNRGVKGNIGALRGMTPEVLDQLEAAGGTGQLQGLGISGAGAEFARTAVGRIHGVRSLILLAAQEDQMISDLRSMAELGADHQQQVEELEGAWRRFENRAQLRQAAMAVDQMGLDIAQAFEPVLNFAGAGIQRLRDVVDAQPEAVSYGALGLGAAYLGTRGIRGLRGVGRVAPFGAAALDTIQDLGTPGSDRGASPVNPVWVAVAYSLSGFGRPRMPLPGDFRHPGNAGDWGTTPGRAGSRWAAIGRGAAGLGLAAAGIGISYEISKGMAQARRQERIEGTSVLDYLREGREGGITIPFGMGGPRRIGGHGVRATPEEQKILDRLARGYINESAAERMLRRVATGEHLQKAGNIPRLEGRAEVTVRLTDQAGRQIQQTKVPLELYPGFTSPAPTTRGKPKTYRGG